MKSSDGEEWLKIREVGSGGIAACARCLQDVQLGRYGLSVRVGWGKAPAAQSLQKRSLMHMGKTP